MRSAASQSPFSLHLAYNIRARPMIDIHAQESMPKSPRRRSLRAKMATPPLGIEQPCPPLASAAIDAAATLEAAHANGEQTSESPLRFSRLWGETGAARADWPLTAGSRAASLSGVTVEGEREKIKKKRYCQRFGSTGRSSWMCLLQSLLSMCIFGPVFCAKWEFWGRFLPKKTQKLMIQPRPGVAEIRAVKKTTDTHFHTRFTRYRKNSPFNQIIDRKPPVFLMHFLCNLEQGNFKIFLFLLDTFSDWHFNCLIDSLWSPRNP